jgi:hypothetical protein
MTYKRLILIPVLAILATGCVGSPIARLVGLYPEDTCETVFSRYDANQDGSWDLEEYKAYDYLAPCFPPHCIPPASDARDNRFRGRDTNKNGKLESEEVCRLLGLKKT